VLSCVSAKKLGNAVKRNKIRRRLKMATRKAIVELSSSFNKKYKYAIFAKAKVYDENFQNLVEELKSKFKETIKSTFMNQFLSQCVIGIIKGYKYLISPLLHHSCRFEPTCSDYFIDSVKVHGCLKGCGKGTLRIFKNVIP